MRRKYDAIYCTEKKSKKMCTDPKIETYRRPLTRYWNRGLNTRKTVLKHSRWCVPSAHWDEWGDLIWQMYRLTIIPGVEWVLGGTIDEMTTASNDPIHINWDAMPFYSEKVNVRFNQNLRGTVLGLRALVRLDFGKYCRKLVVSVSNCFVDVIGRIQWHLRK